jgi:CheY-like chemotaxis protein
MIDRMDTPRILLIDDNPSIHSAMRKVLQRVSATPSALDDMEAMLFGEMTDEPHSDIPRDGRAFEVESAYQGQEGLRLVEKAVAAGRPYALAFVDVLMPPGWDGIETIENIWKVDPDLQIVICTAHTSLSWSEISSRLGPSDSWLVVKKPWDVIEVVQMAHALTRKWSLQQQVRERLTKLETLLRDRTDAMRRSAATRTTVIADLGEVERQMLRMLRSAARLTEDIGKRVDFSLDQLDGRADEIRSALERVSQLIADDVPGATGDPGDLTSILADLRSVAGMIGTLQQLLDPSGPPGDGDALANESARALTSLYAELKSGDD